MSKTAGKEFETEVGQSLRALAKATGLAYRNSNQPIPMCDYLAWTGGCGYLIEAKEIHSDTISFRAITDQERKNLNVITQAGGGEAWVLIKWIGGNASRCFAYSWPDWLELEQAYGFDPKAKRNKPGSGSFPLVPDSARPGAYIELARVERLDPDGHSLGRHWDLSRLFGGNNVVRLRAQLREAKEFAESALEDVQGATGYDEGFEMGESALRCLVDLLGEPSC